MTNKCVAAILFSSLGLTSVAPAHAQEPLPPAEAAPPQSTSAPAVSEAPAAASPESTPARETNSRPAPSTPPAAAAATQPTQSAATRKVAAAASAQSAPGATAAPARDTALSTQPVKSRKDKKKKKDKKSKRYVPRLSGYIQVYYRARVEEDGNHEVDPGVFRFGRVKVRVSGKAVPRLTYVVEIDPRSPQIAGVVRDCYLQWEFLKKQRLRAGQMKTPFGWENRTSSADLFTVDRTEVGETFGRGLTLRDLGLGLFGRIPLGKGFRLEDEVTLTNGAGLSVQADDDHHKNLFGRIGARWNTKPVTLSLGVSGAKGTVHEPADPGPPPQPGFSDAFKRIGADVEADTRYVFGLAEYARGRERTSIPDEGGKLDAWYVLVAGKTPWEVGPVVRYDTFDSSSFRRWTLGAYYGLPRRTFRTMVNYEIYKEDGQRHDDKLLVWAQVVF